MTGSLFAYRPPADLGTVLPPLPPRVVTAARDRRCYRCADCLDVVFTSEGANDAACGACSGRLEYLGRVQGPRLIDIATACACDERCTGAAGPQCSCKCGGENHGTGRTVEVVRDLGTVPRLKGQRNVAKLQAVAAEYRAAVAACGNTGAVCKAGGLRTHRARMAVLNLAANIVHGAAK